MIRFAAAEILDDDKSLDGVIAMIADITAPSTAYRRSPSPAPRGRMGNMSNNHTVLFDVDGLLLCTAITPTGKADPMG